MTFYPTCRTPITDFTQTAISSEFQHVPACHCAKTELRLMECLDAYGMDAGKFKCVDYKRDFLECLWANKQKSRAWYMRNERHRQWLLSGGKKQLYEKPPTMDVHFWW